MPRSCRRAGLVALLFYPTMHGKVASTRLAPQPPAADPGDCGLASLTAEHNWLAVPPGGDSYLDGDYYNRLLPQYSFGGKADTQILLDMLATARLPHQARVLELGFGTGRMTKPALRALPEASFDLVDLSDAMMAVALREVAGDCRRLTVRKADLVQCLEGLNKSGERFDLIYSAWSLSHSVHRTMLLDGVEEGRVRVKECIKTLLTRGLSPGGRFFVIHFDSQSEEQRILMRQWQKVCPFFTPERQSPSQLLLAEIARELDAAGMTRSRIERRAGDPIVYRDMECALETFMNFHLESAFNVREHAADALAEVAAGLKSYQRPDGTVAVRPGCWIFDIERVEGAAA